MPPKTHRAPGPATQLAGAAAVEEAVRPSAVRLASEASPLERQANAEAAAPPRHRPVRKPFGSQDQKLAMPRREGYRRYWFNDEPGRIERAKEAGYEHVKNADDQIVKRIVGIGRDNKGLFAYCMEIPEAWFEEDMAKEQQRVDGIDDSIMRGDIEGKGLTNSDAGTKFYVGKQGIHRTGGLQIRRS
jgi:hypothetical protein